MAELDRQKEKVSFWRILFFIWLTAIFGVIAYLYEKLPNLTEGKIAFAIIGLIALIVFLIITAIKMTKEIDKLKDL